MMSFLFSHTQNDFIDGVNSNISLLRLNFLKHFYKQLRFMCLDHIDRSPLLKLNNMYTLQPSRSVENALCNV